MEQVTSADGTAIAYQRTGNGPPLILVHGMASDHARWGPLIEHISDHFTVYAIDRRGRGGSGDGEIYDIDLEFEDIVAAAHSIDGPVNLYGHSSGALYALNAAPRIQNLRRLALYEPAISNGSAITPTPFIIEIEQLIEAHRPEEALITFMTTILGMPPEELERYRSLPSWPARVAAAPTFPREMRAVNGYRFDPTAFADFHVPTLLLVGAESPAQFREPIGRLKDGLPASRVHELPGQQHVADVLAPHLVSGALIPFLKSQG